MGPKHINDGATWRTLAGNGRVILEAALMEELQPEAPVASAMLIMPDEGRSAFGSGPRCAEFVLHVEPRDRDGSPAPSVGPTPWRDRFTSALDIPDALAKFLSHDLAIAVLADPATRLGLWLKAPRANHGVGRHRRTQGLPGAPQTNWFATFAVADPAGVEAGATAYDILAQLCDFTLHLEEWESAVGAR